MNTSIVTASWHEDFERCKLLCETMDKFVTGYTKHYILVDSKDVALFRQIENPNRIVIDERDLLPSWIRPFPDPTYLGRRRVWLSFKAKPLRGWHVQQLRRIALAAKVEEEGLLYTDSDTAFVKPFDCSTLWQGDKLRLFYRPDALANPEWPEHPVWAENAGKLLGVKNGKSALNDYIGQLVSWRRESVVGMCERIEKHTGQHWVAAIGNVRRFSECFIYGHYVDDVLEGAGHFHDTHDLCRMQWFAPPPTEEEFRTFIAEMEPHQVAIGMQSFLSLSVADIRRIIRMR